MISGDDLEQMDTMGNPGLIPSRGAASCFVTTDNGHTLYSHQIFQGIGADTGNQPSGSGIGAADAAVVQEASFVIEGQDLLGVEDDYQVMVENAQVIVPENNHLSNSVSRELFPVSTGTPRQSRSARASAATVATPSVSGSRSRAGLTGSSVPQTTAALTTATDASAEYFRTLSRNNTLMSRVRFLAYQSHLSVNRKREELLELQRLEQVERLKKLNPHVVIPSHKQSLFSYTNDLCTADPSELLYLDDEEEEASDGEQRKLPILLISRLFFLGELVKFFCILSKHYYHVLKKFKISYLKRNHNCIRNSQCLF